MKLLAFDRPFKSELKKEMRLLVLMTIAFSIAFSWRQTMFDATMWVIEKTFNLEHGLTSNILASTTITLLGLILIFLTSKWFKKMEPYES
jgi:hypothetical protein